MFSSILKKVNEFETELSNSLNRTPQSPTAQNRPNSTQNSASDSPAPLSPVLKRAGRVSESDDTRRPRFSSDGRTNVATVAEDLFGAWGRSRTVSEVGPDTLLPEAPTEAGMGKKLVLILIYVVIHFSKDFRKALEDLTRHLDTTRRMLFKEREQHEHALSARVRELEIAHDRANNLDNELRQLRIKSKLKITQIQKELDLFKQPNSNPPDEISVESPNTQIAKAADDSAAEERRREELSALRLEVRDLSSQLGAVTRERDEALSRLAPHESDNERLEGAGDEEIEKLRNRLRRLETSEDIASQKANEALEELRILQERMRQSVVDTDLPITSMEGCQRCLQRDEKRSDLVSAVSDELKSKTMELGSSKRQIDDLKRELEIANSAIIILREENERRKAGDEAAEAISVVRCFIIFLF
ncbi:hypothetical protein BJ742DRAFT_8449 [Cladochytrium replicatum]|nr:hypothetical protein BJ742DRAFT_8449 [Cladochytrium replicatum]